LSSQESADIAAMITHPGFVVFRKLLDGEVKRATGKLLKETHDTQEILSLRHAAKATNDVAANLLRLFQFHYDIVYQRTNPNTEAESLPTEFI
jgi:hypothetical protein